MKKLLIASAILAIAGQATAGDDRYHGRGCRASDMNGEWVSYQNEVKANPHTGKCTFTVDRGLASGACDFSLTDPAGNPLTDLQFDGTATVNPDCSVDLTMDFQPYGRPFVSTFQLQLAKGKDTYAGRWENTFGAIGTTNGVKR